MTLGAHWLRHLLSQPDPALSAGIAVTTRDPATTGSVVGNPEIDALGAALTWMQGR